MEFPNHGLFSTRKDHMVEADLNPGLVVGRVIGSAVAATLTHLPGIRITGRHGPPHQDLRLDLEDDDS